MTTMVNLRDVAETVSRVVPGVLLRSEAPVGPVADQTQTVDNWPPSTVIDLRETFEAGDSHPLANTANIVHLPVLDRSIEDMMGASSERPDSLTEMYAQLLEPPAAARVVEALEVITFAPTPVLVHCSAGKDRTGVLVALALSLVDVSSEEVVADYVRTDAVIDTVMERLAVVFSQVMPAGLLENAPDELTRAPASAIRFVLDQLEALGGVEEWFLTNGGSPSTIDTLRARLSLPAG